MKKVLITLILFSVLKISFGQEILFTETMGNVSSTTAITAHDTNDGFNNNEFIFSDGGADNPADIRATSSSSGYANASGDANVWFTSSAGEYGFSIEGINTSLHENLTLSFAYRKESTSSLPTLRLEFWNSGVWEEISYTFAESTDAGTGWYLISEIPLPVATQRENLKLRWVKSENIAVRIDDIVLQGEISASQSVISTSVSTLSNFTYTEGEGPSDVQSFTIEGVNLEGNVIVTKPTNYEISLNDSPFAATSNDIELTHTDGTLAETSVFVRLKVGLSEDSYTESITISSINAVNRTIDLEGAVLTSEPLLTIISPENNSIITQENVEIEFTTENFVLGTDGKIAYTLNSGTTNYHTETTPIAINELILGANTISLELVDMSDISLDPAVVQEITITVLEESFPTNGSFEIWSGGLPLGWAGAKSSIFTDIVLAETSRKSSL